MDKPRKTMNKLTNAERELARLIVQPHIVVLSVAPPRYKFRDGITLDGLCDRIRPDVPRVTPRQVEHILEKTWGLSEALNPRKLISSQPQGEPTTAQLRARIRVLEADQETFKRNMADLESRLRSLEHDLYGDR